MKKNQVLYSTIPVLLFIFISQAFLHTRPKSYLNKKAVLQKHQILSNNHPLTVWEKSPPDSIGCILFVHGRTWSSLPDFDLQIEGEDLSLMDGMVNENYKTFAVDLRGYGDTPRDKSQWNSPAKAARDIIEVVKWIKNSTNKKVHLFGWSMGSTLSLLAAQECQDALASLTLFGFWRNIDTVFPPDKSNIQLLNKVNTAKAAASDFIIPGSISQKAIDGYVKASLQADPIRADWRNISDYNISDPSLIKIPVLLLQGEFDPIAPTELQAKLFTKLKTPDKTWSVISGGDHAAHLETARPQFIKILTNFINRFN